jgi:hypothetical protein
MVTHTMKYIMIALSFIALSGCGEIDKVWNAKAPARETVVIPSSEMADFKNVFSDDDKVASDTLAAWRQNITNSFNQIQGAQANFLQADEVKTLVRMGFIKLDQDPVKSETKVLNILELLGYKNGIYLSDVNALFDWLAANRVQATVFYKAFITTDYEHPLNWGSKDIVSLVNFFGSLVSLTGNTNLEINHMADLITPWIPNTYPHAKAALPSGLRLVVSFISSLCGDRVEANAWNGKKIGACMTEFTSHFDPTSPIIDFMFGNVNPTENRSALAASANQFPESVHSWLDGHHHPVFQNSLITDFSTALGIPAPYDFMQLTLWIPKLNSDSTATTISPTFMLDLGTVAQTWVLATLAATNNEMECRQSAWQDCTYAGKFDTLDKLYSTEYAQLIQHRNLGLVSKVALYQSLSEFLMSKLDTAHAGLLSDDIKDLIDLAVSVLDSSSFAQNLVARLLENPVSDSTAEDTVKKMQRQGLSELAAFASDLLPDRGSSQNFLTKIAGQFYTQSEPVYTMDELGITALIYSYDLISNLRADYFTHYRMPTRTDGSDTLVKRRDIVANLPSILHDHFPNIYSECIKWGFERTCGIVYTEILSTPDAGKDEIGVSNLDVLSLTSILLESMMNRCDVNHDGLLSDNILNDFNEKNCILTVSTTLAQRLMKANIVGANNMATALIDLVKGVPLMRVAAEGAISRGTLNNVVWKSIPPFSLFNQEASLGSVMSVAAELMSPKKTKAVENHTVGPIKAPGDELIYEGRLTHGFLPGMNGYGRHN